MSIGSVLTSEVPSAHVLLQDYQTYCFKCLGWIDNGIKCSCGTEYCSEKCQIEDILHSLECELLRKRVIQDVVVDANVDYNLLRLVVRCIQLQQMQQTEQNVFKDMIKHNYSLEWTNSIERAADLLQPHINCQQKDVVDMAIVINCNAHGISTSSNNIPNSCHLHPSYIAIGLFPLGCIFNHSCVPSVTYLGNGNRLTFFSTRPVQEGKELFVSYIASDFMPRYERRGELLLSKNFYCQCRRCSSITGEWWIADWNLIAPMCACGCVFKPDERDVEFIQELNVDLMQYSLVCECGETMEKQRYILLMENLSHDFENLKELVEKSSWTFAGHAASKYFDKYRGKVSHGHELMLRGQLLAGEAFYRTSEPLSFQQSIQVLQEYYDYGKLIWKDRWTSEEMELLRVLMWMMQSEETLDCMCSYKESLKRVSERYMEMQQQNPVK